MKKMNGHFNPILLAVFVVFFTMAAIICAERFKDNNLAVAMMDNVKLFVGALLGLITATYAAKRAGDTPVPTPTPTTPTTPPTEGQ